MIDEFDNKSAAPDTPHAKSLESDRILKPLAMHSSGSAISGALILARIRAVGHTSSTASADALMSASAAAAQVDRILIEISDDSRERGCLVLGWADGAGPAPDQHPSAPPRRLSAIPNLVWAVCLAAAWPHASADPYPGRSFRRTQVLQACVDLGAHQPTVISALDRTLPRAGLIAFSGSTGRLGPTAAALPTAVWSALRRVHDRLPHDALGRSTANGIEPLTAGDDSVQIGAANAHRLPCPAAGPTDSTETLVRAAVTALEIAQGPIAHSELPALADPTILRATEEVLAGLGRALISIPHRGWITGYRDDIVQILTTEQTGTLTRTERSVLALVLLRTVAIPRAQGHHDHSGWTGTDHPTTLDELSANRQLSKIAITDAIRGLRAAGYVATTASGGYVPGPALARLSPTNRETLWEDLVILGRPNGYMAEKIRNRRHAANMAEHSRAQGTTAADADQI